MYPTINGWTKTKLTKYILKNFKGKSTVNVNDCIYHADDGRKCAVGMFIPKNKYKQGMEGMDARHVVSNYKLNKFMPLPLDAMMQLQDTHDTSEPDQTLNKILVWIERNVVTK